MKLRKPTFGAVVRRGLDLALQQFDDDAMSAIYSTETMNEVRAARQFMLDYKMYLIARKGRK